MITIEGRILENRFTTAEWAYVNPILKDRVWGHEVDGSGNPVGSKLGDGIHAWSDLPYWYGGTANTPTVISIVAGTTPMPLTIPFTSSTYHRWVANKSDGTYDPLYPVLYDMGAQHFVINAIDDGSGKAAESYTFTVNP